MFIHVWIQIQILQYYTVTLRVCSIGRSLIRTKDCLLPQNSGSLSNHTNEPPHLLKDVKYSWCEQTNMFFFKNVGYYITCNIRIVEQHVFKHFGVTIWIKRIFWIFLKHVNYLKLLQKEIRWKQIEEEKTNIKNIKNI